MACRITVSAPVPLPFFGLWTLDLIEDLGLGQGLHSSIALSICLVPSSSPQNSSVSSFQANSSTLVRNHCLQPFSGLFRSYNLIHQLCQEKLDSGHETLTRDFGGGWNISILQSWRVAQNCPEEELPKDF